MNWWSNFDVGNKMCLFLAAVTTIIQVFKNSDQ